ncbi:MAG TPA: hypothetical protein VGH04_08690 [Gemmatimonadaceae bacterium]|jgi:hypothetical protein
MNAIAQMLHVARKDLRESRWPFIVYVVAVAVAAARVTDWWSASRVLEMAMFLVVISGVVLVAILIQSDSPIRADAFWATRPLAPTAVLLAKILLVVVIVVGLPVAAQAFAVSSFDIHGMALLRRLATATSAYARWLLIALALASLTKDLKSLIVMFVCIPVALGIASDVWTSAVSDRVVFDASSKSGLISFDQLVVWVGAVGCVALPFWLYARRDRGWRSLAAGTVAAACGLMGVLDTPSIPPTQPEDRSVRGDAIAISLSPGQSINPNGIQLQVRATSAPAGQRLTFNPDRAELDLADGTKMQINTGFSSIELGSIRPPSLANSVWLTPDRDSAFASLKSIIVRPDFQQQQRLAKGIKKITIYGRISASAPQAVGNLRLAPGARLAVPGRRVSIRQWVQSGQTEITVNSIELPLSADASRQFESGSRVVSYALVNDARHEAIPLTVRGTSGGSSWLVLPGDEVLTREFTLDTRDAYVGQSAGVDARWYDGARLWLVDWVPVGRYPVSAELTLP